MPRVFEVVTPEQVAIRYELAGYGSRALAAMLDTLLQIALLLLAYLGVSLAFSSSISELESWEQFTGSFLMAIFLIVVFLIFWGYHIFFETLWNGVTPGKRALGLRVMKDGGHPVDFRAVVIRNLLRVVDILPGVPPVIPLYGFALVSVLCNDQLKRLGDLAAGTIVVRHGSDPASEHPLHLGDIQVMRLLDAATLTRITRITREEQRLMSRFLEQRGTLPPPLRAEFARRLSLPLITRLEYQEPALGMDYERWLGELDLALRTHRTGVVSTAAPSISPMPAPPMPASAPFDDDARRW